MIADSQVADVGELWRFVRLVVRVADRSSATKVYTRIQTGHRFRRHRPISFRIMNFETTLFLGIFGLLSGAFGASCAEAAPYVHWMQTLRRFSQSPLTLAFLHSGAAVGSAGVAAGFDPRTIWIRIALAAISGLLFLLCPAPRA